jgi:hypothetical protein
MPPLLTVVVLVAPESPRDTVTWMFGRTESKVR